MKYSAGNAVWIHPVTSLTTEWFSKTVVQGIPLGAGNPHGDDYRRTTVADAEGLPSELGIEPTGGVAYAKVTVRNGETAKAIVTR